MPRPRPLGLRVAGGNRNGDLLSRRSGVRGLTPLRASGRGSPGRGARCPRGRRVPGTHSRSEKCASPAVFSRGTMPRPRPRGLRVAGGTRNGDLLSRRSGVRGLTPLRASGRGSPGRGVACAAGSCGSHPGLCCFLLCSDRSRPPPSGRPASVLLQRQPAPIQRSRISSARCAIAHFAVAPPPAGCSARVAHCLETPRSHHKHAPPEIRPSLLRTLRSRPFSHGPPVW